MHRAGRLANPLRRAIKTLGARRRFARKLRDFDDEAQAIMRRVRPYTLLGPEKLFSLISSVRYVVRHGVPGDLVECGVFRGGAVMAAALTLESLGVRDRSLFLYDTFSGMTRPTEQDYGLVDEPDALRDFERLQTGPDSSDWVRASLEEVRRNVAGVPYPSDRFVFVPGKVEDTLPGRMPDRVAILRLDTDWYDSTRHEMQHLFPRLVPGGILIVDDYYNWAGNRRAVDEYLEREGIPIFLGKVARSAVGVKP
ncbi:MAG: TylF/MycF/NovP-related O-methyltransferase [Myxococcota bacterium]|nr:TylF/MycF/NovP-related O-methyltransferase [Myxococcota bacterium]